MRMWTRRRLLTSTASAASAAGLAVATTVPSRAATGGSRAGNDDVLDALRALPGLRVIEERPGAEPGYRFFVLGLRQPVDHTDPTVSTFEQRLTLLHTSTDRPTVLFTTGYEATLTPYRSGKPSCSTPTNSRSSTATSVRPAHRPPTTPT